MYTLVVEQYQLDPANLYWIEHWEAWKSKNGHPYDRETEDWHFVNFRYDPERKRAFDPTWRSISAEQKDKLIIGEDISSVLNELMKSRVTSSTNF